MNRLEWFMTQFSVYVLTPILISSCASVTPFQSSNPTNVHSMHNAQPSKPPNYAARIPQTVQTSEKVVIIYPTVHVWGAYSADGSLVRAGLATAGGNWCKDIGRSCRTKSGTFRVNSLGSPNCKSSRYPVPHGGAPMPYCMFFNGNQGLHGSYQVVEGNVSHGCVRLNVSDAEWLRYHFINVGTKVIVKPY